MKYSVYYVCPTPAVCQGNHKTDDKAAQIYADHDVGACVYHSDYCRYRIKHNAKAFFTEHECNPKAYHAEKMFTFDTKKEAEQKMLYEARECGLFIRSAYGWMRLGL